MADNPISLALLDKFTDNLRNYDGQIENAEGILWNRLTEAQRYFMVNHLTTKVDYTFFLFNGQTSYYLPPWIMMITEAEVRDNNDTMISPHFSSLTYPQLTENFYMEFPRTTSAIDRYVKVYPGEVLQPGWKIVTKAWLRPLATDVIDRQHGPIIESDYYDLLIDYVMSFYKIHFKGGEKIINSHIKDLQMVLNEVNLIRNRMYGLNSVAILHPSGWI